MIIINNSLILDNQTQNIQLDNGLHFGKSLFETIYIENDIPEFLALHLGRLNSGLNQLDIKNQILESQVLDAIDLFKENGLNLNRYALKLIVSEKNMVISYREIPYDSIHYEKGFKLLISPILRNPTNPLVFFKSCNYLENIFAREQALKQKFNDALFLNIDNHVAETSIANIFWIKDHIIYTPNIACGILNGIMRHVILAKYPVIQGNFELDFLLKADFVFITNSLLKIMPVSQIHDQFFKINLNILSYN